MKGTDLMIKEAFQSRTIDQKKEEDSLGGLNERLKYLGLIPDGSDVRSHNEGNSNYNDYNKEDLEKDDFALLSKALEDWDVEIKKIRDRTEELIIMK